MFCPIEGKYFKNAKALSNHTRWHTGKMNKLSYKGINKGEKNGLWKGDAVGLLALHSWIRDHKPKPNK